MALLDLGLVTSTLALLFLVFLISKVRRLYVLFRLYQNMPGISGYKLSCGNLYQIPSNGEEKMKWSRDKMAEDPACRKLMRYWHGPILPVVAVYHPDTVKPVLKNYLPKARGFGRGMEFLAKWLGNGLLTINDRALWQRNRKMLTHAFHFDVLRSYNAVFNTACDVMINILSEKADSGEAFDISETINFCVFEGILRCAMGCGDDVQKNRNSKYCKYVKAVRTLSELWSYRVRNPLMFFDFIFDNCPTGRVFNSNLEYVHTFNNDIIKARREVLEKHGPPKSRKLDFIEVLLMARDDKGQSLTDREIRDEVDTFMAAGYDTTATATPWLLYNMAKHPDYQRKVQAELDDLELDATDESAHHNPDHVTCKHLGQLPLLTQCAKESNRMFPPVPYVMRELQEDTVLDGHVVPKGTLVSVFIDNLHHHPDVWKRPDQFHPERFSSDEGRDSFAFIPFSAGPRNCLGQNFAMNEMRVITARILRRFNIELDPKSPPAERSNMLILKAVNGIWVKLTRRHTTLDTQDNNNYTPTPPPASDTTTHSNGHIDKKQK